MASNSAAHGMSRLEAMWEWQKQRKEKDAEKGKATNTKAATKRKPLSRNAQSTRQNKPANSRSIPRYMQATVASTKRQAKDGTASVLNTSNTHNTSADTRQLRTRTEKTTKHNAINTSSSHHNSSHTTGTQAKRNLPRITEAKEKENQAKSSKIPKAKPETDCDKEKQTVKQYVKTKAKKSTTSDRKTVEKKPVEKNPQIKRARSDSPGSPTADSEPQTETKKRSSKRRRVEEPDGDNAINGKLFGENEVTESCAEPQTAADENNKMDTEAAVADVSTETSANQKTSFAPVGTQFTFRKSLTPNTLKSGSSSKSTLDAISEDVDPTEVSDEVFMKPALVPATPSDASIMKKASSALSARRTTPRCRYESLHNVKQQNLSEKLKLAKSPEERIEILGQSPMIELSRRRKPNKVDSPTPVLDLDEAEEVDTLMKVTQSSIDSDTKQTEMETDEPAATSKTTHEAESCQVTENMDVPTKDEGKENSCNADLQSNSKKDVNYFKRLVIDNTEILEGLAKKWDSIRESLSSSISEEMHGEIRTTACQARLVIAERFDQFSQLISDCEFKTGVKPVLEEDLDGFWDMIYFQVEDVLNKFSNLDKLQQNDWKPVEPEARSIPTTATKPNAGAPVLKKKKVGPVKSKGPSKFAAFRAQMMAKQKEQMDGTNEEASDNLSDIQTSLPSDKVVSATPMSAKRKSTRIANHQTPSNEAAAQLQNEKTYGFRRSTMESTLERANTKPIVTPSKTNFNIALRTLSTKKSSRKSCIPELGSSPPKLSEHSMVASEALTASPDLASYLPKANSAFNSPLAVQSSTASPDLNKYIPSSDRRVSFIRERKSFSPSPGMIRAMVNAAQSGKKSGCSTPSRISFGPQFNTINAESLHKKVLNRLTSIPHISSSPMESPMNKLTALRLNDTPKQVKTPQQSVVDDLVIFSPLPSTPEQNDFVPLVTPRRSARIATKRVSLL